MKFKVFRSSDWFGKPCENAYKETSADLPTRQDWFDQDWFVDINSLEELIAFQHSLHSSIIIESELDSPYDDLTIEIYDDYRE